MSKTKYIFLNGLIDLAQSRLGSKIVYKTDEFFAPAKRIINPWPPIFKEGVFDKHGKWMDGWETRRKRNKGHDYLILKLGRPGKIRKVDIDTSYFNGNQPSKVSLDACYSKNKLPGKNIKWINLLRKKSTKPAPKSSLRFGAPGTPISRSSSLSPFKSIDAMLVPKPKTFSPDITDS